MQENTRQEVKVYPSILHGNKKTNNYLFKENLNEIYIQEKLDGSSLSFGMINGEFRVLSRNFDITNDTNFQKLNIASVKELEELFIKTTKELSLDVFNSVILCGEVLGTGKLPYNKGIVGNANIKDIFYAYDLILSTSDKPIEQQIGIVSGQREFSFATFELMKNFATSIGVNFIDAVFLNDEDKEAFNTSDSLFPYQYFMDNYVNKSSFIDNDILREGIVVKVNASQIKLKLVSAIYKEYKPVKNTESKTFEQVFMEAFINDATITKYLQRLRENGLLGEEITKYDLSIVGKNLNDLFNDIWNENQETIMDMLKSKIGKTIGKKVISYVLENEVKEQ